MKLADLQVSVERVIKVRYPRHYLLEDLLAIGRLAAFLEWRLRHGDPQLEQFAITRAVDDCRDFLDSRQVVENHPNLLVDRIRDAHARQSKRSPKVEFSVRLHAETRNNLERLAHMTCQSPSALARTIIEDGIRSYIEKARMLDVVDRKREDPLRKAG